MAKPSSRGRISPGLQPAGLAGADLPGHRSVIGIVIFLSMMIRKWTTEIGVTSHRFVEKRPALHAHQRDRPAQYRRRAGSIRACMGRIFGYGTVRIEGTGVDAVTTPNIADPVGFVRAIQTAKEHAATYRALAGSGEFHIAAHCARGKQHRDAGALVAGAFKAIARHAVRQRRGSAAGPGRCLHSGAPAGYPPGRKAASPHPCLPAHMPMPVSPTVTADAVRRHAWPPARPCRRAGVNLIALDSRLRKIWRSLAGSPDSGSA